MSRLPALTTFGPEILNALIEGSRREVIIELPYAEAVVLRQRMHQLRARMREDKHPLSDIVSAARVTMRWSPDIATSTSRKGVRYPTDNQSLIELVIRPQDSTFRKALEKAGITVEQEPDLGIVPTADPDRIIAEFLKDPKT